MKKLSFLNHSHALLTAMIQQPTPEECIANICNAIYDGAEAFGVQLCEIRQAHRGIEQFKEIFRYAGDRPVYVTNYRSRESAGLTDEQRMEQQFTALEAGATLCDIMGDQFNPSPFEITKDPTAIKKQREVIRRVHDMGKEALMSSHIAGRFLEEQEVLDIVKRQEERGADIAKIVTHVNSEYEMLANFHTMLRMKEELSIPFLFLAGGPYCKLQRMIGHVFGNVMILCVHHHENHTAKVQPILRTTRDALMNMDLSPYRN